MVGIWVEAGGMHGQGHDVTQQEHLPALTCLLGQAPRRQKPLPMKTATNTSTTGAHLPALTCLLGQDLGDEASSPR